MDNKQFGTDGWLKSVVSGAAATTMSHTGLNGDADGGYDVMGVIVVAAAASTFTVQPNGISTNQHTHGIGVAAAGTFRGLAQTDGMYVAFQPTNGRRFAFSGTIVALRGGGIRLSQITSAVSTAATTGFADFMNGIWEEDTTNITSFTWNSSVASGFGVGSWIWVRPMRMRG